MTKHKKIFSLTKTVLSLVLAAALSLSSASVANAAALGIDVSKYQGSINWGAVPSSGVTYAFIRVGNTLRGLDPTFAANVAGAQAAGLRTGVYLYSYATSVEAAVAEAFLVLQWIDKYNINFPVTFDIEDKTQAGLDANTVTAMCNAFCDVIASAGYYPIVYTGANFYRKHITSALRYDVWIAQYANSCEIPGAAIWQASCTGSIPGISGPVDIDYMFKDYNSIILPLGFTQRGGSTYFYNNYRIQFGWVDFAGFRYHMDAFGRMNTGWFADETGTYYLAADGHAVVGQNQIDQDRFYFDELGRIRSGWITVADNQYYYDPNNGCRMLTGWFSDEKGMHYLFPADGHLVKGSINIDKKDYLFSAEGNMLVGWQTIGDQKFFFNPADGAMLKGWLGDITNRYYLSPVDGHMLTGVQVIDEQIYFFDKDGKMTVGWQTIGDQKFFFNPADGAMLKGWLGDITNRYYLSPVDGHMLTGVQVIDEQIYFFDKDGKMTVGWQTIGSQNFFFNPADGAMFKGLIPGIDGIYGTSQIDGHQLKNEAEVIDKVLRCFDANGRLVVNTPYVIGTAVYVCDANGVATLVTPSAPAVAPAAAR